MTSKGPGNRSEKKTEISELRSLLRSNEVQRDPRVYEQVVQKVIAYMTLGIDVSSLCTEMIMAGASTSIVQKKLVYLYLSTYAEQNSELALLTVNTLRKDASDRNPTVRGLALRALTSLRAPNVVEYMVQSVQAGLQDKSAYVRKTAVMGVVKLHYVAPEAVAELNLVDVLYQMLRDKDPQVISNCISALEEILAEEGGMIITKKIAHYLINRLRDFSEWSQCQVLQQLLRYKCQDEEEVYDILNVIDDRLKHVVSGVVFGTIRLFFHLTESLPHIHDDILDRIKTPLLTVIGSSSPEVTFTCLQHIELLQFRNPSLFNEEYHNFFCRYNDPPYVKLKKLDLLTQVANDVNAQDIVEELGECATDVTTSVAQAALTAIGKIAIKVSAQANHCIDTLLSLLGLEIDHITAEIMVTMADILRRYEDIHENVLPRLVNCYSVMTSPKGKAALIWIMGEYGEFISDVPYILEDIIDHIKEEPSTEVKLQLLTATTKTFFKRPPECQDMLGRLLEYIIEEEVNMLVRDKGLLYYRLLKSDVQSAKKIVCGSQKVLSQLIIPPKAAHMFSEFNSLAIVYGQSPSELIDPNPPYTTTTSYQQSERSDTHLDELFVECTPTSDGTSTTVADLMGLYNSSESSAAGSSSNVPHILLNPKPTISAEDFEKYWTLMTSCKEQVFHLSTVPRIKELQARLSKKSVKTLASSPEGQDEIRMFLFAQHVSTFNFFLIQLIVLVSSEQIKVTVKTDNPKLTDQFYLHVMDALKSCLILKKP